MILSLLQEGWHFVFGWAGLDILVGAAAVAIAVLEPPIIAAIIPDLRKWAIAAAVVAFTCTGLIAYGYKNGIDEKQAEWDRAKSATIEHTEKVRDSAVRRVARKPSRWVRSRPDPDLRD